MRRRRSHALDSLLVALQRAHGSERARAARALHDHRDWPGVDPRASAGITRRQADEVFRAIAALLEDPIDDVRFEAAWILARWHEPRAAKRLLRSFCDGGETGQVRGQAAEGLGELLASAASDAHERRAGARQKGLVRRATRELRAALLDPSPDVRFWSARALGRLRVTKARRELAALAREDGGDPAPIARGMWRVADEAADAQTYLETGIWPERAFVAPPSGPVTRRERGQLPRRSHATDLTDDELLLFDALFDCHAAPKFLRRDHYPVAMNTSYTHTLDDPSLEDALRALSARGLVEGPVGDRVSLTRAGGRLWERERRPDWDRFLVDLHDELASGTGVTHVVAPTRRAAERFVEVGRDVGLLVPIGRVHRWTRRDFGLVPWRPPFRALQVVSVRGALAPRVVDWAKYRERLSFWRTVSELDALLGREVRSRLDDRTRL